MSDDVQENLKTYKIQLQQVEASLTTDPDNEDLLKLKRDLQEVIDLTVELVAGKASEAGDSGSSRPENADSTQHSWKVGDAVQAIYSTDGQYYNAVIDEILEDDTCTVTFEEWGNTDITQISQLKPPELNTRQADGDGPDSKRPKSKKDLAIQQRDYKRKKSQKKAQRMKQLEEERESEKNKWKLFNSKTFSKTNKGRVKRSIFATPEAVEGRVGVGTCGRGGQPMTAYQHQEKWKK
ncbi:survival of motor neuron-related-splicing factor 30-like [Gigantopelta aegis]|uniref:survival of motor neuron-related-splicing factor 30-like n=1 Tax=Gigantopelta aegis TaxID=1735272 RepID=UPI001B887F7F|nr:survival of motor neuron-related-splicing factor 30-like [Gigantopelta aegis]